MKKTGIAMHQDVPRDILMNSYPGPLGQVITNLLSNALKFVAPGVSPHVRLWAEDRGATVIFSVQDNGIGITPENAFVMTANGTRGGMSSFGIAHLMDHYGQMVVYLRMNGIVPPASRGSM